MSTSLWAVRLTRPLGEEEEQLLLSLTPTARRARLSPCPEKRREPLCAYGLLALALRLREGWRVLPETALTDRGKPYFPDHPGAAFSLSHTEGAVLAALSEEPVGVDVERIRPVRLRTMERTAGTADLEAFFQTWVRREARSKRTGLGVASMLRSEPPMEPGERYEALEAFPGYAAGAAFQASSPLEGLRRLSLEELLEGLS